VLEFDRLLEIPEPLNLADCVLLVSSSRGKVGLRVPHLPELETVMTNSTVSFSKQTTFEEAKIAILDLDQLLKTALAAMENV
jgi:hypothetical protein